MKNGFESKSFIVTDGITKEIIEELGKEEKYFSYRLFKDASGKVILVLTKKYKESLNTLDASELIQRCVNAMSYPEFEDSFYQPDIEIMYEAYESCIYSILNKLKSIVSLFNDDEIMQEIRCAMYRIKQEGHYIHPRNVYVYSRNKLIMEAKKENKWRNVESLDKKVYSDEKRGETELDCLEDPSPNIEESMIEQEEAEAKQRNYDAIRRYISKNYSERTYDQLLFEYKYGIASEWARKLVYSLKKAIKEKRIKLEEL